MKIVYAAVKQDICKGQRSVVNIFK